MTDKQIDDLKQFIDMRLSQNESYLEQKLEQKLDEKLERKLTEKFTAFEIKMNRRFEEILSAIGDVLHTTNEYYEKRLDGHAKDIKILNHKVSKLQQA